MTSHSTYDTKRECGSFTRLLEISKKISTALSLKVAHRAAFGRAEGIERRKSSAHIDLETKRRIVQTINEKIVVGKVIRSS